MAAPVVSGVAGLIISQGLDRNFNLTNDDVRHIIERTSDDIPPTGFDNETGFGKVNAFSALTLLNVPNVLYHGLSYGGTTTVTNLNSWIYTGGGRWGLASGTYYNVDKNVVTKHINFEVPFCSIPSVWLRERESFSLSQANPNGGYPYAQITNVTQTGFDVTYSTYYVRYNTLGQAINKWIPAAVASTKIAYTVVGEPNPAGAAGPITGPSLVCASGSTYTVNNLPSGCSVLWSCSSKLVKISSSGNTAIFKSVGSGTGQIWATTTSSTCGNVTIPAINVMASPGPITIEFDAPPGRFTASIDGVPSATTYKWYLDGVLKFNTSSISVIFSRQLDDCGHVYYVDVIAVNTCESSLSHAEVSEPPCYNYSIFPNPASTEITIMQNTSKTASVQSFKKPIKEVRIIDKFGRQALTKSFGDKVYETKLNISKLQTGSYTIQINQGADMETYTVIKE